MTFKKDVTFHGVQIFLIDVELSTVLPATSTPKEVAPDGMGEAINGDEVVTTETSSTVVTDQTDISTEDSEDVDDDTDTEPTFEVTIEAVTTTTERQTTETDLEITTQEGSMETTVAVDDLTTAAFLEEEPSGLEGTVILRYKTVLTLKFYHFIWFPIYSCLNYRARDDIYRKC